MPMRIAALALLTDLGCWVSPEQVAKSFNHDPVLVKDWFDELEAMGYVSKSDGMYRATKLGESQLMEVMPTEAPAN